MGFEEKACDDVRNVDSGILYELNKKVACLFSSTGRDKSFEWGYPSDIEPHSGFNTTPWNTQPYTVVK